MHSYIAKGIISQTSLSHKNTTSGWGWLASHDCTCADVQAREWGSPFLQPARVVNFDAIPLLFGGIVTCIINLHITHGTRHQR